MRSLIIFLLAASCEISGCFAFWAWLRLDRSAAWIAPGMALLAAFAVLLAHAPAGFAGRAFAAYGGVYIAAALLWGWAVEGRPPDRWDALGGAVSVSGAAIILLAHRGNPG